MKLRISASTDVGKERTNNEDAYLFCSDLCASQWNIPCSRPVHLGEWGAFAVVADGMGGENAGEVASAIAMETFKTEFLSADLHEVTSSDERVIAFLRNCVSTADRAIQRRIETDPTTIGMGTTVVALWLFEEKAYLAWCGDSRCYVFNSEVGLRLLSKDHSYVQELVDAGRLTEREAFDHPDNNVITRCIGDAETSAEPDTRVVHTHHGDIFLLCSDGLNGCIHDDVIETVMHRYGIWQDGGSEALVRAALDAGGFDNVTVVLLSCLSDGAAEMSTGLIDRLKRRFFKRRT